MDNPEKIMLFLLPLITLALFLLAVVTLWAVQNWTWIAQQFGG